jgi:hypothetical protein
MSNKKITDLPELANPTNDDVFPIVDIATNTTLKVQVGNLPIQTAVTTALATKQATLVSGTNIKTINGTSVLGSGNIVTPQTSGVAGAIQFSDGSAFASDATNLFWDDTNNRLGIGTATPTSLLNLSGTSEATPSFTTGGILNIIGSATNALLMGSLSTSPFGLYIQGGGSGIYPLSLNPNGGNIGIATTNPTAKLQVKGSGSTSATTSLLVQNSAGTELLKVADDGATTANNLSTTGATSINNGAFYVGSNFVTSYGQSIGFFGATVASAIVEIQSTSRGFLPPRMTNAQRSAISSPAVGLMVYCTDAVEGLYINKSTGWTLVI